MRLSVLLAVAALVGVTACSSPSAAGDDGPASVADTTSAMSSTSAPAASTSTSAPATSTTSSTTTSTTTTTTTSTSTSTSTSSTSTSTTTTTIEPLPDPALPSTNRAFDALARANPAVSMTVMRDGRSVLTRASGTTIDAMPATSDSPMVVASVSKLLTGLMIARLDQAGSIDVDAAMPWAQITAPTHPAWADVTPRELLRHTAGVPVERSAWFSGDGDCATFLPSLLDRPPTNTRGRWTYSNGNYCALGLLVEHVSGLPLDQAAQAILFDPLGLSGVHLTIDGQLPTDVAYRLGVERLSRLGGAGTFIVSTDDMAAVLATVTPGDLEVLTWPGLLIDQYGWGHTGSIDSAVACAWVLESGRTVISATVAGRSPSTGGDVCDRVVQAIADDLGLGQGRPDRSPP